MNDKEELVTIAKWRLDSLLGQAETVMEKSEQAVASASIASDNPDSPDCLGFMLKDATRCYVSIRELIEEMQTDFATAE